jgi:hypothetical protein
MESEEHPVNTNELVIQQVADVLKRAMAIDIDTLQSAVQAAHETPANQDADPPERFAVRRQPLRMFWHFRCNLEGVAINATPAELAVAEELEG